MKLKLFKSFFLATSCILVVILTLLFVIMSFAVNSSVTESKQELLLKTVDSVGYLAENHTESKDILYNINSIGGINEIDIMLCDESGNIIHCSCNEFFNSSHCVHSHNAIGRDYMSQIGSKGQFSLSTMQGRFDRMHYVAHKRVNSSSIMYVIATATTFNAGEMLGNLFKIYAVSAIIPLILMFIAEYILTYKLTKPLKYMSIAAKSIAKGDFSHRIPVMSDDEIGELSVLFNRMTDSLTKNETARRSFISNVSHELKTPMTTISGFIDGIIDGTIDENRRDYYLKIVSDEVKRLSRLVQSMLSITRLESDEQVLNPSDFDFAEVVLSVTVSMEQRISDKKLSVEGLDQLSHTVIYADKDLIYQVVYNIIDNAVKYSNNNGYIRLGTKRIGDQLIFTSRNDGIGISDEDKKYIFERFFKADKSRSGNKDSLGLGLYITKTIIKLHGGELDVISQPNEYTEFTVTLPVQVKN